MTYFEMEDLQARMITLECALTYYKLESEREKWRNLMRRLSNDYYFDDNIGDECEKYMLCHAELLKKFNIDTTITSFDMNNLD